MTATSTPLSVLASTRFTAAWRSYSCRLLVVALSGMMWVGAGCKSRDVDGNDLGGLFSSASAPALAKPSQKATKGGKRKGKKKGKTPDGPPLPPLTVRERVPGSCIAETGKPAERAARTAGRPACRHARVLEHRGADAAPRYACIFSDRRASKRKPLPLVIFLHGEYDSPTAVHKKTRLRRRFAKFDLTGDPKRSGFIVLAPQARRDKGLLVWDVDHHSRKNFDVVAIEHFVTQLVDEGLIDTRQIYVVGDSRGGKMASLYAHLFPDRVAAIGTFGADASKLTWTCDRPATPAAVLYRACDTVTPCANVERWLRKRDNDRAPTFSMRLGSSKATEPSCVTSRGRCSKKKGMAHHNRWPKAREGEILEFMGRFSFRD